MSEPARIATHAAGKALTFTAGAPSIMGIINTNPGSFSDVTHVRTTDEQLALAMQMVEAGASIIDVGTDSGVTYGDSIDLDVQLSRAIPLVKQLVARDVVVSIDTPYVEVARACLDVGAAIINDVSGLADPQIAVACAEADAALVIMHTRIGHKQEAYLDFDDVVADVEQYLTEQRAVALAHGLANDKIIFDPGIGYAKHPKDDVQVFRAYPRFAALGAPILTGASRKYYAGVITGAMPPDRLPETLATVEAVRPYPGIVRVHDVDEVARYLAVAETLDGLRPLPEHDPDDDRLKWVPPTSA